MTPSRATVLVCLIFSTGLVLGGAGGANAANRAKDPYAGLDLFARTLTLIERDYVEERDPETLVQTALEGMTAKLDRHSQWMSAEEYARLRSETDGRYEGIGVEVRVEDGGVRVSRVLDGSPAQRDGLQAADLILRADGVFLGGLPREEVTAALQGPRGTTINLTVSREGWPEPRTIETTRDRIDAKMVLGEKLGDVAYIRIVQFSSTVALDLQAEWETQSGDSMPTALVLDLRDNPGGLLDQAVAVVDLFLEEGVIVSTHSRVDGEQVHTATAGGLPSDLPVFILINGMSASASEIVAGALQDAERAVLVGTRTYGKGSVQSVYENRDGSALKLTTGQYFTPSGEPVARESGRVPDHVVPFEPETTSTPWDDLAARLAHADLPEADRAELVAAVDALPRPAKSRRPRDAIPWSQPPGQRGAADPQLAAALKLASR